MGSEKLGTCDAHVLGRYGYHMKHDDCVNWREQPQATRPTLASALRECMGDAAYEKSRDQAKAALCVPAQTEGGEKALSDVSEWGFSGYLAVLPKEAGKMRPLQANLAKLYAAIGPMDELDTVDDAVARVAQLRQERDALERKGQFMVDTLEAEVKRQREARERAEKALLRAADLLGHPMWIREALKSGEGAK